jgi:hypothetical protein
MHVRVLAVDAAASINRQVTYKEAFRNPAVDLRDNKIPNVYAWRQEVGDYAR